MRQEEDLWLKSKPFRDTSVHIKGPRSDYTSGVAEKGLIFSEMIKRFAYETWLLRLTRG